jgi:8-oxo-dGTP diphosphatase
MSVIQVAVGIIINNDNQILIAKRGSHQHQGDKWEFPGGKVEEGETPQEALYRELKEEIGIEIQLSYYLFEIKHKYEDRKVVIDVFEVREWQGEVVGREGQPLRWVKKPDLEQYEFPKANAKILSKLSV